MQQNTLTNQAPKPDVIAPIQATGNTVSNVSNALLTRLIDEVKNESQNNLLAYNRTHNRHNRGR
jgi:hypothetical protein